MQTAVSCVEPWLVVGSMVELASRILAILAPPPLGLKVAFPEPDWCHISFEMQKNSTRRILQSPLPSGLPYLDSMFKVKPAFFKWLICHRSFVSGQRATDNECIFPRLQSSNAGNLGSCETFANDCWQAQEQASDATPYIYNRVCVLWLVHFNWPWKEENATVVI